MRLAMGASRGMFLNLHMEGFIMDNFAIMVQCRGNLVWMANTETLADAQQLIDAGDYEKYDAVLVIALSAFKQYD